MKTASLIYSGICLLSMSMQAIAYDSRGARSCVEWQENRLEKSAGYPLNANIYETWLVGYLSGIVAGAGTDFLAGTENKDVFLAVDDFCTANHSMNLAAAGTSIARQLMLQKGIVNRPTLP